MYYFITYRWIKDHMEDYEYSNFLIDTHPLDWIYKNKKRNKKSNSSERGTITFYEEISRSQYIMFKGEF